MTAPAKIKRTELFAWIGEDELGSDVIGIKQGLVPAGYVPIVAIAEDKVNRPEIIGQFENQAGQYGKKIYLCRFVFEEVVRATEEGMAPHDA